MRYIYDSVVSGDETIRSHRSLKMRQIEGRVVRNVLVITRVLYELNDDKLNAQECGRHLPHLIRALIPPNR